MSNVLSEDKRQQVLALGRLGWSLRRIEQATGIRRETASSYLKAAGLAVRPPRKWGREPAEQAKAANEVITDPAKAANEVITDFGADLGVVKAERPGSISACEPFREEIERARVQGRNAMGIWQDLVTDHGFTHGYQSVRRFLYRLHGSAIPDARAVIVTPAGEEAQVDYGSGPMVRESSTGKYRRTRLFVLTLGYSRKSVRLLTFRSSTQVWAELHERAFRRLGGVPRVIVLDNLREGVEKADFYDPILNPHYRDVLTHYGAVALPCRVNDPNRKGKVESGVGHSKKTPLKGKHFESLEQAQTYLDQWEERWADTRIHGTTKRQVAAMFAEEKPALLPLPLEPFRYYQYGTRVVHLDGCVEVEAAYYGLPPGWIGRQVNVRWNQLFVRILDPNTGQLLREHLRQKRGQHRMQEEDLPFRTPQRTVQLIARAHQLGKHIGVLCESIHHRQGPLAARRLLGVLSLGRKYGIAALDEACSAALEMKVPEYRFVRRYLERCPQAPLSLRQIDPLIRDLLHYRDLIQQRTQESCP